MKKNKVKKRFIIIILIFILLVLAALVLFTDILLSLNGEKEVSICYGDEYRDEGASVLWNIGKAETIGTVDTNTIGSYELTYSFLTEKVTRTVHVEDQKRPEIKLNGSSELSVINGREYVDAGCTAWDEIDGDLTSKVEVIGEVDVSTDGVYKLEYRVYDAAGNGTREHRTITVSTKSPLTMGLLEFDLNQFYDDVICKEVPYNEEKFSKIVFFGDSFMGNMAYYGFLPWSQVLTKPSISTDESDLSQMLINIHGGWSDWTFYQALENYKPEYMVLLCNCDWTGRWTPEYLYNSCDKAIAKMQQISPDTQFIICSLFPLDVRFNSQDYINSYGFNRNDRVNKMNSYYCEICRKYGLKFINAAEAVKNPNTGACYDEYISSDQIHLSVKGFGVAAEYIKNHMDY